MSVVNDKLLLNQGGNLTLNQGGELQLNSTSIVIEGPGGGGGVTFGDVTTNVLIWELDLEA